MRVVGAVECVVDREPATRIVTALLLVTSFACAPRPVPFVAAPRLAPDVLAARLAEADRLATRGCYLCLKEAAAAYNALLDETDDPRVAVHALENNLMLALREIELRIPDSGAFEAARQLQDHVGANYLLYFTALDTLRPTPAIVSPPVLTVMKQERDGRLKLAAELEQYAKVSPMRAYFYIAVVVQLQQFKDIKPTIDDVLAAHPEDLSLKYRMLAVQPAYSAEAARTLIGQETGFGEVHLLLGQRALLNADLPGAFRELTRARELLPDSVSVLNALATITFSYARYADALALYDRILSNPAAVGQESQTRMGRARSLSYLRRHEEAIVLLTDLLVDDARNTPGDKYYWRAWNHLQLGHAQPAYNDAIDGLNAMRNNAIYRLAGMASFGLNRAEEARTYFEEALNMNSADCDSERYLGLLDAHKQSWTPAYQRFSVAAKCYDVVISRLKEELAEFEKDITGLSNGLITAKRAEIREAEALRDQSLLNTTVASRNAVQTK